jgi:hypothetical protein
MHSSIFEVKLAQNVIYGKLIICTIVLIAHLILHSTKTLFVSLYYDLFFCKYLLKGTMHNVKQYRQGLKRIMLHGTMLYHIIIRMLKGGNKVDKLFHSLYFMMNVKKEM